MSATIIPEQPCSMGLGLGLGLGKKYLKQIWGLHNEHDSSLPIGCWHWNSCLWLVEAKSCWLHAWEYSFSKEAARKGSKQVHHMARASVYLQNWRAQDPRVAGKVFPTTGIKIRHQGVSQNCTKMCWAYERFRNLHQSLVGTELRLEYINGLN